MNELGDHLMGWIKANECMVVACDHFLQFDGCNRQAGFLVKLKMSGSPNGLS